MWISSFLLLNIYNIWNIDCWHLHDYKLDIQQNGWNPGEYVVFVIKSQ